MTSDDDHAEIIRLRGENMTLYVMVRALVYSIARAEPDGGDAFLAGLTSDIERLTAPGVLVNADDAGREFIRQNALKFVGGLVRKAGRN